MAASSVALTDLLVDKGILLLDRPSNKEKADENRLTCLVLAADLATINRMAKTNQQVEFRLARLEKELVQLKASLAGKHGEPWYRQIVGDFAGDKGFAHIVRLGRKIRRGKLKG